MTEHPSQQPYLRRLFDGRIHELKDGNSLVGRSEDCDVVLTEEPGLSRKHARITVEDEVSAHHDAEKDTIVANQLERRQEELITSEVRVVNEEFLSRDESRQQTNNSADTEIASISQPTLLVRGAGSGMTGMHMPLGSGRSRWSIGSSNDQDVAINHSSIAPHHATLSVETGRWILRDSGVADNTLVNGRTIETAVITSGDVIRIGDIDCLFVCPREYSVTERPHENLQLGSRAEPQIDSHRPSTEQAFNTEDMTPVAWRDTRQGSRSRRFKTLLVFTALLSLAVAVGFFLYKR